MNTVVAKIAASAALLTALALPSLAQSPMHHETINQRLHNEHGRIRQGIHSDQLTRRETRNLVVRDARIHRQEARDRMAHGGHLTAAERRNLNRRLNRTSSAIYRDKHNNRRAY